MNPVVLSGQSSMLVTFLASFLIWFMFAGVAFLWLVDGRIKREEALHAIFAALAAWVTAQMIKNLFPTERPFEANGDLPMTLTVPNDSAFPSGHTSSAFGMAASLWLHNKKLGLIFTLGAVLIGWARVVSNVHYFIDILGGAVLGIATAYLVGKLHLYKLVK